MYTDERVKEKEYKNLHRTYAEPQEAFRCYYTFRYPTNVCVRNKELISATP
jgi:hypothetical protein